MACRADHSGIWLGRDTVDSLFAASERTRASEVIAFSAATENRVNQDLAGTGNIFLSSQVHEARSCPSQQHCKVDYPLRSYVEINSDGAQRRRKYVRCAA